MCSMSMLVRCKTRGWLVSARWFAILRGGSYWASMVLHTEILALLHGLEFCWNAGIRKLAYFSDSLHTISLLQQDTLVHHHFSNELEMIKRLMRIVWDCSLQHILREGNSCADFLAKKGPSSQERLVILEDPLSGMQQLLLADALGVRFTRI